MVQFCFFGRFFESSFLAFCSLVAMFFTAPVQCLNPVIVTKRLAKVTNKGNSTIINIYESIERQWKSATSKSWYSVVNELWVARILMSGMPLFDSSRL